MAKNIMGRVKRKEPEEERVISNECQANGCPLIGTAANSTNNNSHMWYCVFHLAEEDRQKWGVITARIRNHIDIYNWYAHLASVPFLDFQENPDKYYPHQMPHLAPKDDENLFDYKARILGEFRRLVNLRQSGRNVA